MPEDNASKRPLRILTNNLRKSHVALSDAVLHGVKYNIDILALQEVYWTQAGMLTTNQHWRHIIPAAHGKNGVRARSVILINEQISTEKWDNIETRSGDLTGVRVWLRDGTTLALYNIYDDQDTSAGLTELEDIMDDARGPRDDYVIWLGDFNAHHAIWEPSGNERLCSTLKARQRGDRLFHFVADYGMLAALPDGIGTFIVASNGNLTRPDHIFCLPELADRIVSCDTRHDWMPAGTDHIPILLEIDVETEMNDPIERWDWHGVTWKDFDSTLSEKLQDIGQPRELTTNGEFISTMDDILKALHGARDGHAKKTQRTKYSKRWWTPELEAMRARCERLGEKSQRFRRCARARGPQPASPRA